jgi:hypothetical protein
MKLALTLVHISFNSGINECFGKVGHLCSCIEMFLVSGTSSEPQASI